jgi:hypothetical protein
MKRLIYLLVIVFISLPALDVYAQRCQATTKKGSQCKRNAAVNSIYCWQHGGVPAPTKSDNPDDEIGKVAVTRTGKKYHKSSCQYVRGGYTLMKIEKAKELYDPCSRCNPDE